MMELSPDTKRRLARARLITETWSVGLCMILGSAAAGYGLREYMTRVDVAQIQLDFDTAASSADAAHNEEIARLTTAQQQVVTELYARMSDKDEQLTNQAAVISSLAQSLERLSEKTNEAAEKVGKAATQSQRAATSANKAVKDARGPITEDSRQDINKAIEQANQRLKKE